MSDKYPHLCFLIDLLLELEPAGRFIHIDRPIEESIRSLVHRSAKARGWLRATPEQCERLQRALWEAKAKGLARVPHERMMAIHFRELLQEPTEQVQRVIGFLGLQIRHDQRRRAEQLVDADSAPHAVEPGSAAQSQLAQPNTRLDSTLHKR